MEVVFSLAESPLVHRLAWKTHLDNGVRAVLKLLLAEIIYISDYFNRNCLQTGWRPVSIVTQRHKIIMFKVARTALILLAGPLVLFLTSVSAQAQEGKVKLNFEKETLSADIEQAPLRAVLNRIKEKKGIWYSTWFKGESTLNEKVSVQFRRLPIKDGLERILSDVNHSLVLQGSGVVGVMLFGKEDRTRQPSPRRRSRPSPRRR